MKKLLRLCVCSFMTGLFFCNSSFSQPVQPPTETEPIFLKFNDCVWKLSSASNSTVEALRKDLRKADIVVPMSDYGGFEKSGALPRNYPRNDEAMNTVAGDVILFNGRILAVYYAPNAWSLTPVGKIENGSPETLKKRLGAGDVTITLSLKP